MCGYTHTHSYIAAWSSSAAQHWHECSCGDKADVANHTGNPCAVCGYTSGGGDPNPTFISIDALWTYLSSQPANTAAAPYNVKLNVSDLNPLGKTTIGMTLRNKPNRYVSLDLSGSTLDISDKTFSYCTSLTSITIPASVTGIGQGAFHNCTSLTSVIIAAMEIGPSAFEGCTSLTNITIPASVTGIEQRAFYNCTSLTGITVDADNTNYSSEGGILYNKAKTELLAYPAASGDVTIPAGVTAISHYAFGACTGLTSVTIAEGVTEIGIYAFRDCTGLTSVTIAEGVTEIGIYAFRDCTGLTSVIIAEGVTEIRPYAFYNCTSLTSVTFNGTINSSLFSEANDIDGSMGTFPGDLRAKFYATDSSNGTPGTYTRTSGSKTWTRQSS